jgi:hypothetical protein
MKALGVIAAIAAALYGLYVYYYPSATVRYRLTLVIEADGQQHSGSGVVQVTYGKLVRGLGSSSSFYVDVKGEAISVDIPGRGILFATLKAGEVPHSGAESIIPMAFGFPNGVIGHPYEAGLDRLRALSGVVDLASNNLPLLVRFRDIKEPMTVERVDPNDLTPSFGSGAYLRQATLEITRDPVTAGIEGKLPWLKALKGGYLHDGFTSRDAPLGLHAGDFQKGL